MVACDIDDHFDSADLALDQADTISEALGGAELSNALEKLIRSRLITGFNQGGSVEGRKAGSGYDAHNMALTEPQRSSQTDGEDGEKWLKYDPHNEYALSFSRGEQAARYEAAKRARRLP